MLSSSGKVYSLVQPNESDDISCICLKKRSSILFNCCCKIDLSADQYGSRFIQQKLETATVEEKDMVYEEIMPHALSLMTDVFGNYVVQKVFCSTLTLKINWCFRSYFLDM